MSNFKGVVFVCVLWEQDIMVGCYYGLRFKPFLLVSHSTHPWLSVTFQGTAETNGETMGVRNDA